MEFRGIENQFSGSSKVDIPFAPPTIEYASRIHSAIEENDTKEPMKFEPKISENLRNFSLKIGDTFVTDFDSCLCADETLDKIIELAISHLDNFEELKQEINDIMSAGMRGEIDLKTSIERRLEIAALGGGITEKLLHTYLESAPGPSEHFVQKIKEMKTAGVKVFIFSGGFTQFIKKWCDKHELSEYIDGIYANELIEQADKTYTFDKENLMTKKNGKILTRDLLKETGKITGKILSIGDSSRDLEIGDASIHISKYRGDEDVYETAKNSINDESQLHDFINVTKAA